MINMNLIFDLMEPWWIALIPFRHIIERENNGY